MAAIAALTRAALLAASLVLPMQGASAAPPSPFRALAGNWTGNGILSLSNGEQQRIRCRAAYEVSGSATEARLKLRCAGDSYTFELSSEVEYRDGTIQGQWTESSRNASGSISGRGAGDRIEIAATGAGFSANLAMTTRGNRQSVTIRPQGGADITGVSLALSRR